jgi:hypothetical protein
MMPTNSAIKRRVREGRVGVAGVLSPSPTGALDSCLGRRAITTAEHAAALRPIGRCSRQQSANKLFVDSA